MAKKRTRLYEKALKKLISSKRYKIYEPACILTHTNGNKPTIVYAYHRDIHSYLISYQENDGRYVDLNNPEDVNDIIEKRDDLDGMLFCFLEDGYEIDYMNMVNHSSIWKIVGDGEKISNKKGLDAYIFYCQKHGITKEFIERCTGYDVGDIYPLYIEMNEGYTIVSKTTIGSNCVVLGYNEKLMCPYVTWRTTSDRRYGYSQGNYFESFDSAYQDYKERCSHMLKAYLSFEKQKLRHERNKVHER